MKREIDAREALRVLKEMRTLALMKRAYSLARTLDDAIALAELGKEALDAGRDEKSKE